MCGSRVFNGFDKACAILAVHTDSSHCDVSYQSTHQYAASILVPRFLLLLKFLVRLRICLLQKGNPQLIFTWTLETSPISANSLTSNVKFWHAKFMKRNCSYISPHTQLFVSHFHFLTPTSFITVCLNLLSSTILSSGPNTQDFFEPTRDNSKS